MTPIKPKIETKSIKHTFTPEEVLQLNGDFRRSYDSLKSVEAEFDSVKATYKAKTTEAESRMETLPGLKCDRKSASWFSAQMIPRSIIFWRSSSPTFGKAKFQLTRKCLP
jgi:hypothetical protein